MAHSSVQEQCWGEKKSPSTDLSDPSSSPFNVLDFWALVHPQLVSLCKVQNSTINFNASLEIVLPTFCPSD